ncbi:hypothetical protein ACP4OV_014546 [Aristida adscensionis]
MKPTEMEAGGGGGGGGGGGVPGSTAAGVSDNSSPTRAAADRIAVGAARGSRGFRTGGGGGGGGGVPGGTAAGLGDNTFPTRAAADRVAVAAASGSRGFRTGGGPGGAAAGVAEITSAIRAHASVYEIDVAAGGRGGPGVAAAGVADDLAPDRAAADRIVVAAAGGSSGFRFGGGAVDVHWELSRIGREVFRRLVAHGRMIPSELRFQIERSLGLPPTRRQELFPEQNQSQGGSDFILLLMEFWGTESLTFVPHVLRPSTTRRGPRALNDIWDFLRQNAYRIGRARPPIRPIRVLALGGITASIGYVVNFLRGVEELLHSIASYRWNSRFLSIHSAYKQAL